MIILEKELNTKYVKNIVVIEQENNLKMVLFNTHKKMIPFHRASDDVYIFGYDGDTEIIQIPELKNINPNCDWMVYYNQDEDQVEILYIPFDMFDDSKSLSELPVIPPFNIDDKIKVKGGATKWMKQRDYWLECMGDNIDGFGGTITNDYTDLVGDDKHYEVNIGFDYLIGIHPQWLEAV